ncbi:hypothetical protein FRC12_012929 [Ceratobasidium sp. 428]|nr:hypothetical protein FRC12_014441 [Ceratobasidium sp. 428]KAG8750341.1 hypothetical protein FRC12_012929 [Ceratobasidium sp. 428]
MSSTATALTAEPTEFNPNNPIRRSRIVLTATIGGVLILAVTAAIITIRVSRWLRGRSDRKRRRRILNFTGGNRQKRNAWDVQEWEGTPA